MRLSKEYKYSEREDGCRVEVEKTILNGSFYKSIQLNVLFEDDTAWYDLEMQVADSDSIPKRRRYYHSMIDIDI